MSWTPQPDDKITAAHAAYLVSWANQIDARVQVTDANADTWAWHLQGRHFGTCQQIIADHYGRTGKAGEVDPISAGDIRRAYASREASAQAKQRALAPPPRRAKSKVPRWFVEKGQREWGAFKDRDPNDYD